MLFFINQQRFLKDTLLYSTYLRCDHKPILEAPLNDSFRTPLLYRSRKELASYERKNETIHVAVTCCGSETSQLLTLFKSLVIFSSNASAILHIFVDPVQTNVLLLSIELDLIYQTNVNYIVYEIAFPTTSRQDWEQLFKRCASQRLFLPLVLTRLSKVIYVDYDVLFLRPVIQLWHEFDTFEPQQSVGLVREQEKENMLGYDFFAKHPYPVPAGLNSGVMLMHLERMRLLPWSCVISRIFDVYRKQLLFGDQDILNIFFFFHPSSLHLLPCSFNYRIDNCNNVNSCPDVQLNGVAILHGNRNGFIGRHESIFQRLYELLQRQVVSSDGSHEKLKPLLTNMQRAFIIEKGFCVSQDIFSIGLHRLLYSDTATEIE